MSVCFPHLFDCILTKNDYKPYNVPEKRNKVGNNCSIIVNFNGKIGLLLYVENFFAGLTRFRAAYIILNETNDLPFSANYRMC